MKLSSPETITILALDKHQQSVFRVQFLSGGCNPNLLEEAMAFGLHLLKLEPQVVYVGVYDGSADMLASEKFLVSITQENLPHTEPPASRDQQPTRPPPSWARVLVRLILESSLGV